MIILKCFVLLSWFVLISPFLLAEWLYHGLCDLTDRLRWWCEDDEEEANRDNL